MIKRRYFKDDIRKTFIIYALIPIVIVTIASYTATFCLWNQSVKYENAKLNNEMTERLLKTVREAQREIEEISSEEKFQKTFQDFGQRQEIYALLYEFTNQLDRDIEFYILDDKMQVLMGSKKELPKFLKSSQNVNWGITRRMSENPYKLIVESNKAYEGNEWMRTELVIGKAVQGKKHIQGYITFVLNGNKFVKNMGEQGNGLITTDKFDNIYIETTSMYSDALDKLKKEFRQETGFHKIEGKMYYIAKQDLENIGLRVYAIESVDKVLHLFIWGAFLFVGTFILLTILIRILASYIARKKTKIIDQLVEAFEEVEAGNLECKLNMKTYDEFEIIGKSYNHMIESLKNLMQINEEKTRQTTISEVKQLESQFNPHFLFNTLEHIKYMIKLEPDAAGKMIVSLSQLLRYSINNKTSEVTLGEEMSYVRNYLKIQQLRFKEKLQCEIKIEQQAIDCIIPKLVIQPIIENAIKYGAQNVEHLELKIRVRILGEELVIVVYDNGKGMNKKVLEEIQMILGQPSNHTSHIGLYNVQRRIKLLYGEAKEMSYEKSYEKSYGLEIRSEEGEGTVVRLVLPMNLCAKPTSTA